MKRLICMAVLICFAALLASCTAYHAQGVGAGGALGGIAGALLDSKNPWRGAVIGGALGAIAGATITDISMRASKEAAQTGKPVDYRSEDGSKWVHAEPVEYNAKTKCTKVHLTQEENGKVISDEIKKECRGEKTTNEY
ncbi:MAG: hypothetical protein A3J63_03160 [Candidatus Moranbacteria bacterium RIFCSPHIGHO2_02_FULL_40_12b]|nr:MAG: hypothetical protein A3J63_03160 [Candidatus Moranbacteria bacterium RIFCSPHIGHO2_02_FULL_40_12b]